MRLLPCLVGCALVAAPAPAQQPTKTRFEITVPAPVRAEPITGRVFVMIAPDSVRDPRLQIGRTGVPFFGRDIERLQPGRAAVIDGTDLGSPVKIRMDIPPGEYYVQAMINVYSEFRRADGHVLWMHDDQWEGQHWTRSPGNFHSVPRRGGLPPRGEREGG